MSARFTEMSLRLLGLFQLWHNPVFLRFCRSRLRLRKSIFWYLLTLIVTTFVVVLVYVIRTNSGTSGEVAARGLWIPLLIIQGLILMFKGTGSASVGLIQDRIDETIDYQRLTPLSPIKNLLGYLFGLPVLEYLMFALTLPHLIFIVVVGNIPVLTALSVYFAFFCCVALYHIIAIATGMVIRKWIWGYLLSILMVGIVNIILPTFISQLGLKFLQFFSVWPVIGQEILPLIARPGSRSNNIYLSLADSVPFFNWNLSPFVFTLMLQGALIATFGIMALRRWKFSAKHSLSKSYALAFLCGFIVLLTGNVWPAVTGRYMPFALFGQNDINELSESIAIGLPLVYSLIVWLLCLMLFSIVIPTQHAFVRGIRRATKLGRRSARPWDDDSGNLLFPGLIVLAALIGYGVLYREMSGAGFFEFLAVADVGLWRLPLSFGLVLLTTALCLQVLENRGTVLAVLLLWIVPILVATVLSAIVEGFGNAQAVIASLSPLALILMAGALPAMALIPDTAGNFNPEPTVTLAIYTGLLFVAAQIAFLSYRWYTLSRGYYRAGR